MARSITDKEISLIKAMLKLGMRNVDIQFYFNRPERHVNEGRISQIKHNTYGPDLPPANQEELDKFFEDHNSRKLKLTKNDHPKKTIIQQAKECFAKNSDGFWYLLEGETSTQESKLEFDPKRMGSIIRSIAAMANNKGGFIFIGVEDVTNKAVGLQNNNFEVTDIAFLTDKVKSFLTPTPDFTKEIIHLNDLKIGILHIQKHIYPPVIVYKDGDKLDDGTILFRYPGQSSNIKFGDLSELLSERDAYSQNKLLNQAKLISKIGVDHSMILDTQKNQLNTDDTAIMIDTVLADQLKFIKEGEFNEVEGATALKLVGDVRAVDQDGLINEIVEAFALTPERVLKVFLYKEKIQLPYEYIKLSALIQRQWLPIFYFVQLDKHSLEEIIYKLDGVDPGHKISKKNALLRLQNKLRAFTKPVGNIKPVLKKIQSGDFESLKDTDDTLLARAITSLPDDFDNFDPIYHLLKKLFTKAIEKKDPTFKSHVFKASSRLDELVYKIKYY